MRSAAILISSLALPLTSFAATAALDPMFSFGGGDGWRAPREVLSGDLPGTATAGVYNYLGTASLERGLAYNPTTGNLVLVSRSTSGNGIRLLNGMLGHDVGSLNQAGTITGGLFAMNMVDVTADGTIYVANLATIGSPFKVYSWPTESAPIPFPAHVATVNVGRIGDSFAAYGVGPGTVLAAAGTNVVAASNFATFNSANGFNFNATAYTSVLTTSTATNDYRLGLTFVDSDTLIGSQGGPARMTDFSASLATVTASLALGPNQRALDFATVDGTPLLAVLDSATSLLSVYDIATPSSPSLLVAATTTSGPLAPNTNGTGAVCWGAINGSSATLYAMDSNQGIQAFNFTLIPEPSTGALVSLLGLTVIRRRRS